MAKKKKSDEALDPLQAYKEAMESLVSGTDFKTSADSVVLTQRKKVKTPIEAMNCIFGGGIPFGTIAQSYGPPKAGKSTWLYVMMGIFQKTYPTGIAVLIDNESSGDGERLEYLGVDTKRVLRLPASSIESGFLALLKMLENKSKNPNLKDVPIFAIWDTISKGLATDGATQSRMNAMDRARIIKNYMSPVIEAIEKHDFFLGLINQVIYKTDSYGNTKMDSGGGIALKHDVHLSTKLEIYNKGDGSEGNFIVRRISLLDIDKSKISPEFKNIPVIIDIREGGSVDQEGSFIEYMMDLGYITQSSGWYRYDALCDKYALSHLYYPFYYYLKSFRYDEIHKKVKETPLLYNAFRYMFMETMSELYKLQARIIKPYMAECLEEIRSEYDSPQLYMEDNRDGKKDAVVAKLKENPELVAKIRETVEIDPAVCLTCGEGHDNLYTCDCKEEVVITSELAKKILDEAFQVEEEVAETTDENIGEEVDNEGEATE